jgi:crotonobetainyl-CoA:carnitine CoA-transferase CaiB-like acyl-CoA transferase
MNVARLLPVILLHFDLERADQSIMATKTLEEWTALSTKAELTFAPVATLPE